MAINEIVRSKRIFQQEAERDYKYLILDPNKIKQHIYFDYVIGIKHGDLQYPKKWLRFFSVKPEKGQVVPIEEYNRNDYQYIFMPNMSLGSELKNELELLGYPTDSSNDFKNFLIQLDHISDALMPIVRQEIESCLPATTEPKAVYFYEYEEQGETVYFLLELGDNPNDIVDEVTSEFQNMVTLQAYEIHSKDKRLYKIKNTTERYNAEKWLIYSEKDANFPYFEELHDLEDLLPYTAFRELQVK